MRISKEYNFSAAHHLPNHKGKCKNPHGHNYRVIIVIEGEINQDFNSSSYGMVLDFDDLDSYMDPLVDQLDHKDINELEFPSAPSTAEHIADWFGMSLVKSLGHLECNVYSVEVFETPKASATWTKGP